jgi:antitoxin component of MazEF toxin-antitoxin module
MAHAILGRWGKNRAVRFPGEIASELDFKSGDRLEIEAEANRIVIRRAKPAYTIEAMFAGKSAEEWRALYAGAYHWGPDVGREIIEE